MKTAYFDVLLKMLQIQLPYRCKEDNGIESDLRNLLPLLVITHINPFSQKSILQGTKMKGEKEED